MRMRQYTFSALVVLDPAAREEAAGCDPGGIQACCLVEPSYRRYFPAVISLGRGVPSRARAHALVTVALYDSEAGAFFAPGQRFTIWADAVIGHSVQAAEPAGCGVISCCVSLPVPRAFRGRAARRAANLERQRLPGGTGLVGRRVIEVTGRVARLSRDDG